MTEHRTTDTDELAPYPDMTGDDLRDFERFADDTGAPFGGALVVLAALVGLLGLVIAVAAGIMP